MRRQSCCPSSTCRWLVVLLAFFLRAALGAPNVVLFVADDLGYGELGCYGQKWIETPHLDRLAAEGMRFTDFYAGNAVCAPSRCCLLTGKHPGHAYIRDNGDPKHLQHLAPQLGWEFPGQNPIPDESFTLGELFQNHGYATAAIGKWGLGHFGTTGDPNQQGFDLFYGFNCQRHAHNHYPKFLWRNRNKERLPGNDRTLHGQTYSQDRFTEVAIDFIREHQERPFLLYVPFAIPHLSIQVPDESLQQYTNKIPEEEYVHRGYLRHPRPRAGYAGMVSHMDRDIGKILAVLDELQLKEQTIVLFTSDNGPTYNRLGGSDSDFFQSAAGYRGLKGSLYEGGIRVPLIVRWPGAVKAGSVSHYVSAFWDLMPTLADAAELPIPNDLDGRSLVPALTQQAQHRPGFLYWEFPGYGGQQALREGRWKAIRQNIRKNNEIRTELYDLDVDPAERNDVAKQHPQIVAELSAKMSAARTPSSLFPMRALDKSAP